MKTLSSLLPAQSPRSAILVRIASQEEVPWFDGLLGDHHYLGAGRPVGDYLRQRLP